MVINDLYSYFYIFLKNCNFSAHFLWILGDFQQFSEKTRTPISNENWNSSSKNRPIDLKIGTNDPCNGFKKLSETILDISIFSDFMGTQRPNLGHF